MKKTALKNRGDVGVNIRWCNDCGLMFKLYAKKKRGIYYCPFCGDSIAVVRYEDRDDKPTVSPLWTTLQERRFETLARKGLNTEQLAEALGRTKWGIRYIARKLGYGYDRTEKRWTRK